MSLTLEGRCARVAAATDRPEIHTVLRDQVDLIAAAARAAGLPDGDLAPLLTAVGELRRLTGR